MCKRDFGGGNRRRRRKFWGLFAPQAKILGAFLRRRRKFWVFLPPILHDLRGPLGRHGAGPTNTLAATHEQTLGAPIAPPNAHEWTGFLTLGGASGGYSFLMCRLLNGGSRLYEPVSCHRVSIIDRGLPARKSWCASISYYSFSMTAMPNSLAQVRGNGPRAAVEAL